MRLATQGGLGTGLGVRGWGWLHPSVALPVGRCLMPIRIWVSWGCNPEWDVPKHVLPDLEGTAGVEGAGCAAGHL